MGSRRPCCITRPKPSRSDGNANGGGLGGLSTARRERVVIEGDARISVNDGVAIARRGDVFTVLWKAPVRIDRIQWMFDAADRFALNAADGILALVIVLPTSSAPDHRTAIECMKRLRNLRRSTRRQATVAVGGGVWQSVVMGVHRVFLGSRRYRSGGMTFSGTIDEGVARLLEKASRQTPPAPQILEDVRTLHDALDVVWPESWHGVQVDGTFGR
jgi:hypothetical protein